MKPRILITKHVYPEAVAILEGVGDIQYHDTSVSLPAAELQAAVADKHAMVCQLTDHIDAAGMSMLSKPTATFEITLRSLPLPMNSASIRSVS